MSALDEILARKPETFEEAEGTAVQDIINFRQDPTTMRTGLDEFGARPLEDVSRTRVKKGSGIGFFESLKQGFIDDAGTKVRRTARERFPDDPSALRRFGMIDGKVIFVNDDGDLEAAKGGFKDAAGTVTSFAPEIAGSVVGSLAAGAPLTGAAIGAAGGKAVKEIIGGLFFDDPTTAKGVMQSMVTEGATDFLAGGLFGKVATGIANRKAIKGIAEETFKSETKRQEVKALTGIELDLAQVTNLPKLKALKIFAANFPGDASEVIRANDELIGGQVDDAITRILNIVSKPSDPALLGTNAINAAQAAITAARTEVAAKVSPLYKQAFAETLEDGTAVVVDVKPVLKLINDKLVSAKGGNASVLEGVRDLLKIRGKKTIDTSVEGLHEAKMDLDRIFETGTLDKTAIGRTLKRDLVEIKETLLNQISEVSPVYNQARELHGELTEDVVAPLRDGIIGVISNITDQKAAQAAAKMFSDGTVSVQTIRRAKRALEKQDPEAWNGLVRQWLAINFNKASKELQTGEVKNLAGKFRQLVIGTKGQKAAMSEALGPEARPLFDMTMEALQMVSSTPTGSSSTHFNELITGQLKGSVGSVLRAALSPKNTTLKTIDDTFLEKASLSIAEALTDPTKVSQLKALTNVRPSTERTLIIASIIGLSIVPRDFGGRLLFPPGTIVPEMLKEQDE